MTKKDILIRELEILKELRGLDDEAINTKRELVEADDDKVDGFVPSYYWSSTTYPQCTNGAYYVNFSDGTLGFNVKSDNNYVRCVRFK